MITIDAYSTAIAELSLSGEISLGRCSKSTAYRWKKEINDRLSRENANWRVRLDVADRSLTAVPAETISI